MKKILIIILAFFPAFDIAAQDFAKDMTKAKTAYTAGNLEETHFALQQAMQEIDMIVGKEILKLLPPKMDTLNANQRNDNVSSNSGYIGTTIRRDYGKATRRGEITIISNSPMISMVNAAMSSPMMGNDGKSKTVKVQGYKGRMEKQEGNSEGITNYQLQIPMGNALITFNLDNCTDTQFLALAETIPLQEIATLIQ